ncbi:MAG: RuvA C-terminal domain-containing protein [Candidatus Eisenbacteria bacterium]|nr:RuvA C-terminal domain-containing protein [Candidatus Eisenbacteria bacterium]
MASAPHPRLTPLAPQRYALQLTIGQATHDKLRYAQALLGHQLPSGDLARVLDRALEALIEQLERRKFAATSKPHVRRVPRSASANPRYIPAEVKRAVWERDGGRCTFVGDTGHRCPARKLLEFDHVEEVARGGRATVAGIRLRCRAHNQYAAECTFGADFMNHQRAAAREAAAARAQAAAARRAAAREAAEARARAEEVRTRAVAGAARARAAAAEVIPYLRGLGFRADEARRAATRCESVPDASLEERVRVALSCFAKPPRGRAVRMLQTAT